MYVILAGGGKIGLHLIRTLMDQGHEVALIEKDQRVCSLVVDAFPEVVVLAGDATHYELLRRAQIERADCVVAVAGRDQDNYILCKMAKCIFGVSRVLARVNDPRNEELFRIAGVDFIISVTSMVTRAIESEILPHTMMTLFNWHGRMSMVEAILPDTSPVLGLSIRKLDFPEGSILASIWRDGRAMIPSGETVLRSGDECFAITLPGREDQLRAMLVG